MAEPLVRGSLWTQDPGGGSAVPRGSVWCFIHMRKSSVHRRTSCEGLSPSSTPTQDAAGPAVPPHLPLPTERGLRGDPGGSRTRGPGISGPCGAPRRLPTGGGGRRLMTRGGRAAAAASRRGRAWPSWGPPLLCASAAWPPPSSPPSTRSRRATSASITGEAAAAVSPRAG